MAKRVDPTLLRELIEESEQTRESPYPADAGFVRPNRDRSKVYSIRLSDAEYDAVRKIADAAHLPPSTLVRSWILQRLDKESHAVS
jgi:hypothetical protein